jgi:uncharacterized protein YuzE
MGHPEKMYVVRVIVDVDRNPNEAVTAYRTSKMDKYRARAMKVSYDEKTDILSVVLKEGVPVSESDEDKAGGILDYDKEGDLVSLEILDASRRVTATHKIEFETVESEKRA